MPQTQTTTTAPPAAVPIDCLRDGSGNGLFVAADNNGAGGCLYTMSFAHWCGPAGAHYQLVSPAGTFLVSTAYEGLGLAFFTFSDGAQTEPSVC